MGAILELLLGDQFEQMELHLIPSPWLPGKAIRLPLVEAAICHQIIQDGAQIESAIMLLATGIAIC